MLTFVVCLSLLCLCLLYLGPGVNDLHSQDQYDTIDFTDNEIRILDNFPKMKRLSTLLMSNNYLFRIGSTLGDNLASITTLVLNNNRLSSLSEIDHLATLSKLELLSLTDNPVTEKEHYRLYVIFKIPSLKMLDFQKVSASCVCIYEIESARIDLLLLLPSVLLTDVMFVMPCHVNLVMHCDACIIACSFFVRLRLLCSLTFISICVYMCVYVCAV